MDLNKDNRDIYTIDRESYSEYMKENIKEPRDLLSSIIQLLMVILLFVLVYLFFNILKNDLTFSEVFNKKELVSTYESLTDGEDEIQIEAEAYSEVLSEKIATVSEKKPIEHIVIVEQDKSVVKELAFKEEIVTKEKEPIRKIEPEVISKENKVEEVRTAEKVIVLKEVTKPMKRIETVQRRKVVQEKASEVMKNIDISEESELTESYLKRMIEELNSEN